MMVPRTWKPRDPVQFPAATAARQGAEQGHTLSELHIVPYELNRMTQLSDEMGEPRTSALAEVGDLGKSLGAPCPFVPAPSTPLTGGGAWVPPAPT